MICRGTIEEKIYQRQIFKLLLTSRILDDPKQKALFTKSDIKELFQFDDDDEEKKVENIGGRGSALMGSTDLPQEGKVVLLKQQNSKVESSNLGSISVYDSNDQDGNSGNDNDRYKIDEEIFIDQKISMDGTTSSSSSSALSHSHGSGSGPGSGPRSGDPDPIFNDSEGQDSHSRDKRLLQALFDGEALSAVYDHSYIEPGMGGSDAAREQRALHEQASARVDQAMRQLQASAPSYRMNEVTPTPTAPSSSSSYNSSSYSSRDNRDSRNGTHTQSQSQTHPRFGGSGSGSSQMLAGIRANKAAVNVNVHGNPSLGQGQGIGVGQGQASTIRTAGHGQGQGQVVQSDSHQQSSPSISSGPSSISGDILRRLNTLFSNCLSNPPKGSRDQGLSTEYILHHFSDLGDQYASIFKDSLHQVAIQKNGKWFKR